MKLATALLLTLSFSVTTMAADLFATYEVPVGKQADLSSFNQFRIQKLSLEKVNDGQTSLKYLLPLELTGTPNVIEFKGELTANGETALTYDKGSLNCAEDQISLTCQVSYSTLNINQPLAAKLMAEKFGAKELPKRLKVLGRFSTDPVGIITIYKRIIL